MIKRTVFLLTVYLAFSGCGKLVAVKDPPQSCTVNSDATGVTIACDDGSTAFIPVQKNCTVVQNKTSLTLTCPDGSSATVTNGTNGTSCSVSKVGTKVTITCTNGTSAVVPSEN